MALEGRCDVETWGEFGFSGISCSPKVVFGDQTDIFICTGCDEVCVFSITEKKLSAVLHFPGSVSDLVPNHDKQLLYVACMSGVYCVPLQFLPPRGQSSQADVSSCPAELKVPSEFLAVPDEGVLSLLLVGSVLLTVSLRHTSWMITLYSSQNQSFPSSYEMLTSFSLPLVLSAVYNVTGGLSGKRRPVLVCVHSTTTPSSSSASQSESITSGHFCLELVLFKLLFGIDVALAKSPVVLCGLPDGRLYFLPLHLPGSRLHILHSLEQPVIFVGPSALNDTGPGKAQCLVAVGEQGKVVLIKTKEGGPEEGGNTAGFIERRLPGPVICGCINKNSLYYSIGSDLLKLDLSYGLFGREDKERKDEASSKKGTAFQSPASLNVCRVISLAELTGNTAGKVQLLALSLNGQLQRITLPVKSADARLCMEPSGQVGRSVRDLLSAIGDVCERASKLKSDIKSKNQILKCLNQVLNISFLLTTTAKSDLDIQEKPIRCHAVTRWSRLLQKDSLTLTCVLDNSSPYILEQGWTLCVHVFPLQSSPSEVGENSSTNLLFPFNNIHPGETLEVSLPLPLAAAGEVSFPMTVSCSLIFSLSSLLGKATTNCPGLQSSCISLPLNTLTVDWLHALKVIGPVPTQTTATSQWRNTTTDAVQAFLSSGQFRCNRKEESPLKPEQHSASVKVSSELLRNILVLKNSDLDGRGGTCAPHNVCVSLLEWLLFGESGGVRRVHQGDEISSSGVSAEGPNEHTVKLTAEEVNVGEESTGRQESPTTVVLQIESASVAAVCGLHHAVLRRLQTLLQNVPETAASPTSLQSLGLRQTLHRVEHLLQQIRCTQVSGAFGVGVSTGQMSRSLLSVYRELRENPLILI